MDMVGEEVLCVCVCVCVCVDISDLNLQGFSYYVSLKHEFSSPLKGEHIL